MLSSIFVCINPENPRSQPGGKNIKALHRLSLNRTLKDMSFDLDLFGVWLFVITSSNFLSNPCNCLLLLLIETIVKEKKTGHVWLVDSKCFIVDIANYIFIAARISAKLWLGERQTSSVTNGLNVIYIYYFLQLLFGWFSDHVA